MAPFRVQRVGSKTTFARPRKPISLARTTQLPALVASSDHAAAQRAAWEKNVGQRFDWLLRDINTPTDAISGSALALKNTGEQIAAAFFRAFSMVRNPPLSPGEAQALMRILLTKQQARKSDGSPAAFTRS